MIALSNLIETPSESYPFDVPVDTGFCDDQRLDACQLWLVMWCTANCEGKWTFSLNEDRTKNYKILMKFTDPEEAVHFKLASGQLYKDPLF